MIAGFVISCFLAWRDECKRAEIAESAQAKALERISSLKSEQPMRGIEKRDALVEFIRTGKVLRETLIKSHTGVGEAEKWLESLFEFGRRQLNMAQNNAIRSAELTPGDSFEMHLGTIHAFSAANYSEVAGRLMAQLRELEKVKDSIVD